MAQLYGIAMKEGKRRMRVLQEAYIARNGEVTALHTKHNARTHCREVIVHSFEQWAEACDDLGLARVLPWELLCANLCVLHTHFSANDVGKQLQIGPAAVLEVVGEHKPRAWLNAQWGNLYDVMTVPYRAGVRCRVINDGDIKYRDSVRYIGF